MAEQRKVVNGGKLKLKLVQVICPACGQQVEAVARDGRVKGYCAVAKQYVDFLIETQPERKKWWQDPEYRARLSSAMKKKWQDPEYRAKQIATHTGRHPTAGTRAKISAAKQYVDFQVKTQPERKKWWQDPEYRARLSAGMKKKWQDPEYRAKQIATHTGRHPTAETRAKISAVLKRQNKKG